MKNLILSLCVFSLILLPGDFGTLGMKKSPASLTWPERPCPSCQKA